MQQSLLVAKKVVIGFVEDDRSPDPELRVEVDGIPKTCRGFISDKDRLYHILCHIGRFKQATESEQYRLIHHEYAGLAGLERNDGAASDYEISRQLEKFLEKVTVMRLALKGGERSCGAQGTFKERIRDCDSKEGRFTLVSKIVVNDDVYKVYLGPNGQLWSAPLPGKVAGFSIFRDSKDAEEACKDAFTQAVALPGVIWEIPTRRQIKKASAFGIKAILESRRLFWTSSTKGLFRRFPVGAYFTNAQEPDFWISKDFGYSREDARKSDVFTLGAICIGKSR